MLTRKVLMISAFKDTSGYARAARNYARCLAEDENFVIKSVKYDSGNNEKLSPSLLAAHKRSASNAEVIVQMLTPNEMRPVQGKKNIAICCWETDRIPQHWVDSLNKFDLVIVPCEANRQAFKNSGVTVKIDLMPFVFFREDYIYNGPKFKIPGVTDTTTIFYNISQWSPKKGLDDIIKAYFLAFQNDEDVLLVLKGYIGMQNQHGDADKMRAEIENIKKMMRLPKYPRIYVTDTMMTPEEILRLHKSCNIYVNASRGEGWGIPCFESLLIGNELISVNHTGITEYLPTDIDTAVFYVGDYYKVLSYKSPVISMGHPDPMLYTSLENWYQADILSLRDSFKESINTLTKRNINQDKYWKLTDPTTIGNKLKELINNV